MTIANLGAAGEKDEIEGQFQQLGDFLASAPHGGHSAWIEITGYEFER
jgi:hypothetical protein